MLTEPNRWMLLLVSFLETWRELGLVHQKPALVALSGTPGLLYTQLGHWWRFPPPSGFPTCFHNTLCKIDRGGYVEESSESLPFLIQLGLRVFFFTERHREVQEKQGIGE